jgi:hypothetical protein
MDPDLIIDSFYALRIKLRDSDGVAGRFRDHVAPVVKYLDAFYWSGQPDVSRITLYGSWLRGTAVSGLSNINIAYEMPPQYLPDFAKVTDQNDGLLDKFYHRCLDAFPTAHQNRGVHSVTIPLTKGRIVEVSPLFRMNSGEMGYPDFAAFGQWRRLETLVAHDALLRLDPVERENVIMVCRAARIWRSVHSVPISGFLIDALALTFIAKAAHRRKPQKYQDCLVRDFFGFMAEQRPGIQSWEIPGAEKPAFRHGPFEEFAAAAYSVAQYAIEQATNRQDRTARAAWRFLFGEYY